MKVKVHFFTKGVHVHGMHDHPCFLVTILDIFFLKRALYHINTVLVYSNKENTSAYSINLIVLED